MRTWLSRKAFDGYHCDRLSSPSSKVLAYKHTRKVMDKGYLPGQPRFYGDFLNLWTASALKPIEGNCDHINALVEHLFPEEYERAHILNALAFHVANPGAKVSHVLMITGVQGSGKNTLVDIIRPIVGSSNARVIGGEALQSRFNSELVDVQALAIDEVVHRDGWAIANAIKPLITDDTILAEAKRENRRRATTPRLIFILSNDRTPLPLEPGDRRFFVPAYGTSKLSTEFYTALHAALDHEVPAFYAELLKRDVSGFNPKAAPPITQAKLELQAAVRPPLERQLREMIEDRRGVFACDVVIPQAVMIELRMAGHALVTEQSVTRALKEVGARSLGQLPSRDQWQGRPRCWAIRNHDEVEAAGPAAWARMLAVASSSHSTHQSS